VHELVKNDVVAHGFRRHDQAPVQRNGPIGGTGAPAGALVAHRDPPDVEPLFLGEFVGSPRQFLAGKFPKKPLRRVSHAGCLALDGKREISEGDANALALRVDGESCGRSPEQDLRAVSPFARHVRALGFVQLFLDPVESRVGEGKGFALRAESRDGQANAAVVAKPEDVMFCATVPHVLHGHDSRGDDQNIVAFARGNLLSKQQVQLHARNRNERGNLTHVSIV